MDRFETEPGSAHPLGMTTSTDGVNFSVFSQAATEVFLLLFDSATAIEPMQTIRLDPFRNKTFHFWHVFVRGCGPRIFYALRVDGPADVGAGHRFNPNKVLIGPYARGIRKDLWKRADAIGPADNLATSLRCAVVDPSTYDWEGDRPLRRPIHESIIYEVHVGGFTRSSSSGVAHPGTFAGMIEKIPYLQALGVTAVELLPMFEFDDTTLSVSPPGDALRNYWGYSTIGFFSPHSGYCVPGNGMSHMDDFRDLVKALHKAGRGKRLHKTGLEVILDVVFNHTD
jgi:glycogen operon protein